MRDNYSSITHRNLVQNYPQNIRLERIVKQKIYPLSEGFEELREKITKFSRQGPPTHIYEAHEVEYLNKSVSGYYWADNVLTQRIYSIIQCNFQKTYYALDTACIKRKRVLERNHNSIYSTGKMQSIIWTGQRKYSVPGNKLNRKRFGNINSGVESFRKMNKNNYQHRKKKA